MIPFTKINSKWIVDFKIQNYKILENNIIENLGNVGYGDDFLDKTANVQPMKE